MDANSRKLALDLLNQEALKLKHRQFVFITPQDLSSVRPSDSVSILAALSSHGYLPLPIHLLLHSLCLLCGGS